MADAFLKGGQTAPAPAALTDKQVYFSELGQAVAQIEYEIQTRDSNTYKQSPLYNNQTTFASYIDSLTTMYRTRTTNNYPGTKEEVRGERVEPPPPPPESSTPVAPAVADVDINSLLNPVRYKFIINQGDISNFPRELRVAKQYIGDRNAAEPARGTAMAIERILNGVKVSNNLINQCNARDLETEPPPKIQVEGSDIKITCEGDVLTRFRSIITS